MVAAHLAVVAGVDDPRVVEEPLAPERTHHVADRLIDDRHVGGVRPPHPPDGIVRHGLGVGDPQEGVQERAVPSRPLGRGAPGRARHGDVDVPVARHRLRRSVPGIMGAGKAHEEEERLRAVVALDPLHGLLAVPGVDVGRQREGRRCRVPHRHALGGVPSVLVLTLIAAVGEVPLVGVEQAHSGEIVGVTGRDLPDELVARLEDLREAQCLESSGHVVHVRHRELLVEVEVCLAQERRVVTGLPQGPRIGRAPRCDLGGIGVDAVVARSAPS